MTRLTPEAEAFRALMQKERADWPPELIKAATYLRCELDIMQYKSWEASGGPAHLKQYADEFAKLYAEWRASIDKDV